VDKASRTAILLSAERFLGLMLSIIELDTATRRGGDERRRA
jgi:hypothetical protein